MTHLSCVDNLPQSKVKEKFILLLLWHSQCAINSCIHLAAVTFMYPQPPSSSPLPMDYIEVSPRMTVSSAAYQPVFPCALFVWFPGHYMYVDSVYVKHFQEVAQLISPMTTAPMSGCLSFYYQLQQGNDNVFTLYTRDVAGLYEEIWRVDSPGSASWNLAEVEFSAPYPMEVGEPWPAGTLRCYTRRHGGHATVLPYLPQSCFWRQEYIDFIFLFLIHKKTN